MQGCPMPVSPHLLGEVELWREPPPAGVPDSLGTRLLPGTRYILQGGMHRFLGHWSICQISASEAGRMGESLVPSVVDGRAPDVWGGRRDLHQWPGLPPLGVCRPRGFCSLLIRGQAGERLGLLNWSLERSP